MRTKSVAIKRDAPGREPSLSQSRGQTLQSDANDNVVCKKVEKAISSRQYGAHAPKENGERLLQANEKYSGTIKTFPCEGLCIHHCQYKIILLILWIEQLVCVQKSTL